MPYNKFVVFAFLIVIILVNVALCVVVDLLWYPGATATDTQFDGKICILSDADDKERVGFLIDSEFILSELNTVRH